MAEFYDKRKTRVFPPQSYFVSNFFQIWFTGALNKVFSRHFQNFLLAISYALPGVRHYLYSLYYCDIRLTALLPSRNSPKIIKLSLNTAQNRKKTELNVTRIKLLNDNFLTEMRATHNLC